ncbi:hypothetical protein [Streptacidiphilus sp. EB129]|jgi:protein-tyrosine phosphatase|uniref:arsenate reductase/protein-tyrosine-phosphatase family protein n=1 Tax=Streptacidiphilus sp. EB129 TaxID=3156262 RepID=UPI0035150861
MNAFQLRFVCTANLCRSPLAERIAVLRAPPTAATQPWLVVTSAGTDARGGMPMHPLAARQLREIGADPAGFSSRRLTAAMVAEDDLVLTADLAQRDAVVALCPAASRRTFLIGEFARLAQHPQVPVDRSAAPTVGRPPTDTPDNQADAARRLVATAARYRGRVPWHEPAMDEIADPDGSEATVTACARQIDRAVTQIVLILAELTPLPVPHPMRTTDPRS